MQELPDLSQLSHNEKDDLIRLLWSIFQDQAKQIVALQSQVAELQSKLNKNSRNSSKPPSSDGLSKPAPKSLRIAGENPTGGQKGHSGRTLSQATEPDKIIVHNVPDQCHACQRELPFAYVSETRQVFDLPVLHLRLPSITSCKPSALAGMCIPQNSPPMCEQRCNMAHVHRLPWCTSTRTMPSRCSAQRRS
jgi:transposase